VAEGQEYMKTLLLKSQCKHINHLDEKLGEVAADVASLEGGFSSLKGEFKLLETGINTRFDTFGKSLS